jgi:hypothetical protein
MTEKLSGLAAVLAAVGLSADSKDTVSRAALDSAISAALLEGEKAGVIKAGVDADKIKTDASAATNARIKSIITAPEAKGREGLAHSIAFDTELSAEQATAMLKASPEAQKASRLDGNVPVFKVDSADPSSAGNAAKEGLAAATQRLIEKTYGKGAAL